MRLVLIESRLGKVKSGLAVRIGLDTRDTRPLGLIPTSPIRHGDRDSFPFRHLGHRWCQLQERYTGCSFDIRVLINGNISPQYFVPRLQYIVASSVDERMKGGAQLIID